jgi:uncharacterized membrane protein
MEDIEKPQEEAKTTNGQEAKSGVDKKIVAAVGYLPFLCIWPLLSRETDEFLAFHGRQGLLLTILSIAIGILSQILVMAVPLFGMFVVWALDLIIFGYVIVGAWKAYKGEKWVLPYIGQFADKLKF